MVVILGLYHLVRQSDGMELLSLEQAICRDSECLEAGSLVGLGAGRLRWRSGGQILPRQRNVAEDYLPAPDAINVWM